MTEVTQWPLDCGSFRIHVTSSSPRAIPVRVPIIYKKDLIRFTGERTTFLCTAATSEPRFHSRPASMYWKWGESDPTLTHRAGYVWSTIQNPCLSRHSSHLVTLQRLYLYLFVFPPKNLWSKPTAHSARCIWFKECIITRPKCLVKTNSLSHNLAVTQFKSKMFSVIFLTYIWLIQTMQKKLTLIP